MRLARYAAVAQNSSHREAGALHARRIERARSRIVVEALSAAILGGRIGGSTLVIDAMSGAPVPHGIGYEFVVIGNEDF